MVSLRRTCVELHGEGQAIRFCALEFALHPNAVHLELSLAVHEQPTVDAKLRDREQRVGQPEYAGVPQGRVDHVHGSIIPAGGSGRGTRRIEAKRNRRRSYLVLASAVALVFTVAIFVVKLGRRGGLVRLLQLAVRGWRRG